MKHFNPQPEIPPRVLATDLDGTLIPLPKSELNRIALGEIFEQHLNDNFRLIYATGRHFDSVLHAMKQYDLPAPEWIICDVGSAIFKRKKDKYESYTPYKRHLSESIHSVSREDIEKLLFSLYGLELQSPEHQQRFKVSYQCGADIVDDLLKEIKFKLKTAEMPYDCMGSLDPFRNCGLIDVLPKNVSKAYALLWLSTHADFRPDEVIYSGDSGNDYAALISGFRAVIVANGSHGLVEKVRFQLKTRKLEDRLYVANGQATSGVLEGCQHFGLF